jgi:hypothetical protein
MKDLELKDSQLEGRANGLDLKDEQLKSRVKELDSVLFKMLVTIGIHSTESAPKNLYYHCPTQFIYGCR